MSSVEDHLLKIREERIAREKARIAKLHELNLKKYNQNLLPGLKNPPPKLVKSNSLMMKEKLSAVKNNSYLHGTKRPITAPIPKDGPKTDAKTNELGPKQNIAKAESSISNSERNELGPKQNIVKARGSISNSVRNEWGPKQNIVKAKGSISNSVGNEMGSRQNIVKAKGSISNSVSFDSSAKTSQNTKITGIDKKASVSKIATKIVENKPMINKTVSVSKIADKKAPIHKTAKVLAEIKPFKKIDPTLVRKNIADSHRTANIQNNPTRKSLMPKMDSYTQESVFDRLYKPKFAPKSMVNDVGKLQKDPAYVKKGIKTSSQILKRHTCFETANVNNKSVKDPVRRSISAVHFKRISKNELGNCIHRWASIGDKLDKQHLTIDEEETLKEGCVVSAVKSERKKVKFMTPISHLNTPRPEELQARLKSWLQKRGKSLDAYQHLQCFGIHHLHKKSLHGTPKMESKLSPDPKQYSLYSNEENKENIALDSDSDDGSYTEIMNNRKDTEGERIDIDKWRQTSFVESEFNESGDFNETTVTVTSADTLIDVDDVLIGALNDLAELLREGFDWEQSARYLRAIRERFPAAPRTAAYWECRAALEERRGDLHASVQCWEEAIAKGTEHKVAEANLDSLLNKFMQLKISPNSRAAARRLDPKMVDVKNVFKSTIIRFAVQQAKLRQSETPVFTVTPVRRSGRLSHGPTPTESHTPRLGKRTPLRLFDSVRQVTTQHVFIPNDNLVHTP